MGASCLSYIGHGHQHVRQRDESHVLAGFLFPTLVITNSIHHHRADLGGQSCMAQKLGSIRLRYSRWASFRCSSPAAVSGFFLASLRLTSCARHLFRGRPLHLVMGVAAMSASSPELTFGPQDDRPHDERDLGQGPLLDELRGGVLHSLCRSLPRNRRQRAPLTSLHRRLPDPLIPGALSSSDIAALFTGLAQLIFFFYNLIHSRFKGAIRER